MGDQRTILGAAASRPVLRSEGKSRKCQRLNATVLGRRENLLFKKLAEREGFEPPIRLPVCRISSAVHSTTLPPLRSQIWALNSAEYLSNAAGANKSAEIEAAAGSRFPGSRRDSADGARAYCDPASPALVMIPPQSAISALMKPSSSSGGGERTGASPSLTNSWRNCGSAVAALTSR